ncbi:nitronate monooxygenase [Dyella solisilvae]|uniref:Propionate 3-nitronate monooxygenase n=1 Tax=Dyella solisilvae TaxID=1920168 RepID=A0A370KBK3_9GAMM|nr:nitronate monooxygenase [Dyella solisilvae]RDJ00039.1 nitronate monooxygenase [Dyella solisilvae]
MPSRFLARLGVAQPLVLAPMSGASTPALVAAVSNAGGLGSHGVGYLAPQAILDEAAKIRALTDRPFALNLFVLPDEFEEDEEAIAFARATLDALMEREGLAVRTSRPERWAPRFSEQFAALCEARPAAASFTFNLLTAAQVRELKQRDIAVIGSATTLDEVRAWAALDVDAISLQSAEAGGHRGSFLHRPEEGMIGLFALLRLAARAVTQPLIAGGGIMDGRGMLAAEVLGADVAQLGTAFLACPESAAAQAWKGDLSRAQDSSITTIRSFSGRAARGLRNTYVEAMAAVESRLPGYPVMNALTAPLRRAAAAAGRGDLISEWSGQGVGMLRAMPAAALVASLLEEYGQARQGLS